MSPASLSLHLSFAPYGMMPATGWLAQTSLEDLSIEDPPMEEIVQAIYETADGDGSS